MPISVFGTSDKKKVNGSEDNYLVTFGVELRKKDVAAQQIRQRAQSHSSERGDQNIGDILDTRNGMNSELDFVNPNLEKNTAPKKTQKKENDKVINNIFD